MSEAFEVTVQNVDPVLVELDDQEVIVGQPVSFLGEFSDPGFNNPLNPEGEVEESFSFVIDWGDGTVEVGIPPDVITGSPGVPSTGSFPGQHVYAEPGIYTVRVTVNDDDGGTTFREFTVTVDVAQPTLIVPEDQQLNEGEELSIVATFTDPQGAESYSFVIDWGDGQQSNGVTSAGEGGQGSFGGMHTYADDGLYTVTVTLFADDRQVTETFEVTVTNVDPALVELDDQEVIVGQPVSFLGEFSDPGFNNPLNPEGEVEESFSFVIDWGDGTVEVGIPPDVTTGSPGVPSTGSFPGQHAYAEPGIYTVRVTVNDDDGGTTFREFTVTVNEAQPILTVPEDQQLNEGDELSIVVNFSDPQPGGAESYSFVIDWGDGFQTVGMTSVGEGGQGSFGGMHTYADDGLYTVTVTLFADERQVTETFEVTVLNVAPVLDELDDQVVDDGEPVSFLGEFSDPGFNNPLNPEGEVEESFSFVIDWGDGTVEVGIPPDVTTGSPGVPSTGSFPGQHVYAEPGVYTVRVTINDDDGGTSFQEFTVTIRPADLTLIVPPDQRLNEGANLSLPNIGVFIDPSPAGAELYSYTIDWGDGMHSEGVAVAMPAGEGDVFQGSFGGSHVYADDGVYMVRVIVSAGERFVEQSFQVTVDNVAPTLSVVGNQAIALGAPLSLGNFAQFSDPGFNNPLNPEGETAETFSYIIEWGDGLSNVGVPGVVAPGGPGIATTGAFGNSHFFGSPGVFTVTVTVNDDDGGSAVQTFEVTVFVIRDLVEIRENLAGVVFVPGGGGGPSPDRVDAPSTPVPPGVPQGINRLEPRRVGTGSVAGAEPRLVLRVVSPDGVEDRTRDEPLPDEILDKLRQLFERLADGHYRIYQIQPDGVEILVVDVIVRQGRYIDVTDESEGASEALPRTNASQESTDDRVPSSAEEAGEPKQPAALPDATDQTMRAVDESEAARAPTQAATAFGGLVALAAPRRRPRRNRIARGTTPPKLDKVRRLLRRLR
jgi:PKD repeat protein